MKATLFLLALIWSESAVPQESAPPSVSCEVRAAAAWVTPGEQDTRTRLVVQAMDETGAWHEVPTPDRRVLVTAGVESPEPLHARTHRLAQVRELVGQQCAEAIAQTLNRSLAWAVVDEEDRLLPGLSVPLRGRGKADKGDEPELSDDSPLRGELYTLEGDDLLVLTYRGKMTREKAQLFAVPDSRKGATRIAGSDPSGLQGPLREIAVAVQRAGLEAELAEAEAVFAGAGELRLVLTGKDRAGKKADVTFPHRAEPLADGPGIGWGRLKKGALAFVPSEGVRVLALDDWPVRLTYDGDFSRLRLTPGRHRLTARINVAYSSVQSSGKYAAHDMREWTPPRVLDFEVAADCAYELRKSSGEGELTLVVTEKDRQGKTRTVATAATPWGDALELPAAAGSGAAGAAKSPLAADMQPIVPTPDLAGSAQPPGQLVSRGSSTVQGMLPACVDFSPDGRRMALSGLAGQASTNPGRTSFNLTNIQVFVALSETGKSGSVRTLVKGGGVSIFPAPIAFSADGSRVATLLDGRIQVWDAETGRTAGKWGEKVSAIAFALDQSVVLARHQDGSYAAYAIANGEHLPLAQGGSQGILLPVDAGRLHVLSLADGRLSLRDLKDGQETSVGQAGVEYASDTAALSHDGRRLALLEKAGAIVIWDVAAARPVTRLERSGGAGHLRFSRDGRHLAFSGDGKVSLWEHETGTVLSADPRFPMGVSQIAFTPDSRTLAVTGTLVGAEVRLYEVPAPLGPGKR